MNIVGGATLERLSVNIRSRKMDPPKISDV